MVWCPYTDKEIDASATTPEHIVPLALGGVNAFTIPVDSAFNSSVGSEIDGVVANDFLTLVRRRELDARGHSNKPPQVTVRKALFGTSDRPAQITFRGQEGLAVWDAKDRRYLPEHEIAGQSMSIHLDIKPFDRLRFLAKVALSTGYFVYGEQFRNRLAHEELRALMNANSKTSRAALEHSKLRAYYEFSQIAEAHLRQAQLDSFMCDSVRGSCVLSIPGPKNVGFVIGILGKWVGTLNVPADTTDFPLDGAHDLGHVVLLTDGTMERASYRQFAQKVHAQLESKRTGESASHDSAE